MLFYNVCLFLVRRGRRGAALKVYEDDLPITLRMRTGTRITKVTHA